MIIITESLYYSKSSKEIAKRISKIKPLPKSLSMKGPYARFLTKYLIKSIIIYEFNESDFLEALEFISKRLSSCDGISGYRYDTKIWENETTLLDL